MTAFLLGLLVGVVLGHLITRHWEPLVERAEDARANMPEQERVMETGAQLLRFARRYAIIILVLVVILAIVATNVISAALAVPTITLGANNFVDACGNPQVVNVTMEDVNRGTVPVGTGDCLRTVELTR